MDTPDRAIRPDGRVSRQLERLMHPVAALRRRLDELNVDDVGLEARQQSLYGLGSDVHGDLDELGGLQAKLPWGRWLSARRALDLGDESGSVARFVGGMRVGMYNATWPLATLRLFSDGLRLQSTHRFWSVPTWEARYDELIEAQAVGKIPPWSTGVRFRARVRNDWVVFWTTEGRR